MMLSSWNDGQYDDEMFVCYSKCISLVRNSRVLFIHVLAVFIGCHLVKYISELSNYGSHLTMVNGYRYDRIPSSK